MGVALPTAAGSRRRLLVVGAAGFLGRAVVRAGASLGWEVRGLVRDAARGEVVRSAGGVPVVGNILDPASLRRAVEGCSTIVHLAAASSGLGPSGEDAYSVRVTGTAHLVEAGKHAGVTRLVVGSGYWVYADRPGPITEDSPLDPRGESRINHQAERVGLAANAPGELEVLVVRPGMVYGNGAWFRPVVEAIRDGIYEVIDGGANRWSFASLEDTGAGFVRVVESGAAGEVYNLVDDDPRPWGEFSEFVAQYLGRERPGSISYAEAVGALGPEVAHHLRANRAASSAKLEALGWRPRFPSFRYGVPEVLREMGFPDRPTEARP